MTAPLRFALLSEGSSDRALVPLLRWLVAEHVRPDVQTEGQWVDRGRLPRGSIAVPAERLRSAVRVYGCDLLFVHRDADRETVDVRRTEIAGWVDAASPFQTPVVPVIPVRCTEAWLMVDDAAIRRAAGNPNGRAALNLPTIGRLEAVADPKLELYGALRSASGLTGRRLKAFDHRAARCQIGDHIADPARLRRLAAFRALEGEVAAWAHQSQWGQAN